MDQQLFRGLKEDFKELAKDKEVHAILAFGSSVSREILSAVILIFASLRQRH